MTRQAIVLTALLLLTIATALVLLPGLSARGRLRRSDEPRGAAGLTSALRQVVRHAERSRRGAVAVASLAGAAVGAALGGGPVGAVALAGYCGYGVRILSSRRATQVAERSRAAALDAVAALADDLRAGLAPTTALGRAWPALTGAEAGAADPIDGAGVAVLPDDPVRALRDGTDAARSAIAHRLASAWRLAERTGTPLADLLDRLNAELAARERLRHRAAAQAAGARATAVLLALLPIVGIGLGVGIGADPLQVLLHTPVGFACAAATMGLQLLGSWWAGRLGGAGVREATA